MAADRSSAARVRLAGFWNAWFRPEEIERARALAETATEEECQAELDRLDTERDRRLDYWRSFQ